ncbi:hypothetical protein ALC53_12763 [Atta colombica]|uniref:Uncharacterized protein n=1 Tax=Atta colombica TaxID=520822 RepID=A0A195AY55_9HYME|nr:hypothetical protein ALC53_12763 [Atta colombica]
MPSKLSDQARARASANDLVTRLTLRYVRNFSTFPCATVNIEIKQCIYICYTYTHPSYHRIHRNSTPSPSVFPLGKQG